MLEQQSLATLHSRLGVRRSSLVKDVSSSPFRAGLTRRFLFRNFATPAERDNIMHIAHFHTGGVPGRHELDETQELNWGAVARAIADTGFSGYLAHEFVPTRDPLKSLEQAVAICDA